MKYETQNLYGLRSRKIAGLVNMLLDTVMAIANGAMGGAAKASENAHNNHSELRSRSNDNK